MSCVLMTIRTDRLTTVLVDLAVNTAAVNGVAAGANGLFGYGIPLELARRVLLHPQLRRRLPQPPGVGQQSYFAFSARQASNRSTRR